MKKSILLFSMIVFLAFLRGQCSVAAASVSGNTAAVSGNDGAKNIGLPDKTIQLQVPENIDFIIDPWGVAGRGQVYSDKYTIRNCGTREGVLYLSDIICFTNPDADIAVTKDKQAVSHTEEKSVYIEMVFDTGETLLLSQTGQEYCIRCAPGEEIVFWISGAVSSNVANGWEKDDVMLSMKYKFCAE